MSSASPRITVLVLTYNEEKNLPQCLDSVVHWANEILVVDSGSDDSTVTLAESRGARVLQHSFETHSQQWNWALERVSRDTEWILALDADQSVTPTLREEIDRTLSVVSADVEGLYVRRRQIFRGRWIKHGGYYPKYLLKLFRRECASADEGELVDHHFYVGGKTLKLEHDIVENNLYEADITTWSQKHLQYSIRQAREERLRREGRLLWPIAPRLFGNQDERVWWMKRIWLRLPLYLRPFLYFGYRYFLRLGFLDGKEGFVFHFLQSFWYRLLVDINMETLDDTNAQVVEPQRTKETLGDTELVAPMHRREHGATHRS